MGYDTIYAFVCLVLATYFVWEDANTRATNEDIRNGITVVAIFVCLHTH